MLKSRDERIILALVIWGAVAFVLFVLLPIVTIIGSSSSDLYSGAPCHELAAREDIELAMKEQGGLVSQIKAIRPDLIDIVVDTQRCGGNQAEIIIYHGGAADKEQILPLLQGPLFDFPYRFVNL